MTGFWIGAAALAVVAVSFLLVPLWRERKRSGHGGPSGPLTALAIVPVSVGLYLLVTTFDPDFDPAVNAEEMAIVQRLAERLGENPDNPEGWLLLGRSYIQLGDYPRARLALEQAWNRTESPSDALKISYAESMLFTDGGPAALGFAGDLIEGVLATSPSNQRALWWGGLVAAERNQPAVAVQRFTALLATNPPPEIVTLIREQLDAIGAAGSVPPAAAAAGPFIELDIRIADDLPVDRIGPNARLFLYARGATPAPLAAQMHPVSALPGRFTLSDADSPMAAINQGGSLAGLATVTVGARISLSGTANAQPGDFYTEAEVDPAAGETVNLVIDRVVPSG